MTLIEKMQDMSPQDLRAFANSQGVTVHWKAKPETIIEQVMAKLSQPVVPPSDYVDPRLASKEAVFHTKEQIEEMLKPIRVTRPDFECVYDDESRSVTFRCRGAEDSHSMSTPLHWLRQKAVAVSRGRVAPMGHDKANFDQGNASGKNAYTNTVLA